MNLLGSKADDLDPPSPAVESSFWAVFPLFLEATNALHYSRVFAVCLLGPPSLILSSEVGLSCIA